MPKNFCIMQIWAEPEKAALPICNYSQILYQFLTFTQNLKRSQKRFVYSLRGLPIIMGSPLKMEVALWRKETFPYMTPFTQT